MNNQQNKIGILLTNIGTPDSCTVQGVRAYLAKFLTDRRVIKLPTLLRKLIVNLFILPFRPKRSLHAYQKIWTEQGSPLLVTTEKIATKLQDYLTSNYQNTQYVVKAGMSYSSPSIAESLMQLIEKEQCDKIFIVPMFPQYSASTTASTFDYIGDYFKHKEFVPSLTFYHQYYQHPLYIQAIKNKINLYFKEFQLQDAHLLFSFHGIPKDYAKQGDPYECFCYDTAMKVANALALKREQWTISFQSRLGPREWLQPYTDKTLVELAQKGTKTIAVVCPGFAVDCLETLEEIAILNKENFLEAGGQVYHYIPALNDDEEHIAFLAQLITQ